jgi:hypothetical protein
VSVVAYRLNVARGKADRRDVDSSMMTREYIEAAAKYTHCHLTGHAFVDALGSPYQRSMDRFDSSLPYTPSNVRWVCLWANLAKGRTTPEDFVERILSTAKYLRSKYSGARTAELIRRLDAAQAATIALCGASPTIH